MARGWGWWGAESPEAAFIYEDGREGNDGNSCRME